MSLRRRTSRWVALGVLTLAYFVAGKAGLRTIGLLCGAASIIVLFEDRNKILFFWLAAFVFIAGSILALATMIVTRRQGASLIVSYSAAAVAAAFPVLH